MLVVIGVTVALYALINKSIIQFHIIPFESHARKHGIIVATVLLGDKRLVYKDGKNYYRNVFDAEKLNKIRGGKIEYMGFPNAFVKVTIVDGETGEIWSFYFEPRGVKEEDVQKFISCASNLLKASMWVRVSWSSLFADIWEEYKCLTTSFTEKGVYMDEFPVAIKNGDDVHPGRMIITFSQWFK